MGSVPFSVTEQMALVAKLLVGAFSPLMDIGLPFVVIHLNLDFLSLLWLLLITVLIVDNHWNFTNMFCSFLSSLIFQLCYRGPPSLKMAS